MIYMIVLGIFLIIFGYIINMFFNKNQGTIGNDKNETNYYKKDFMTQSEQKFYNTLKELEPEYRIVPQICLRSIIKNDKHFGNELFRLIDYAIFNKDYTELLLLIELNDDTHNLEKRKQRDNKVKDICSKAGIELMIFYTKYPNNRDYVIPRIKEKLYNNRV